jgi:propionyl-CoA carboxylase beta chain
MHAVAVLLSYLPSNHLETSFEEPFDRSTATRRPRPRCRRATSPYDVRLVVDDVLDEHTWFELRPAYAPSMVTGLGRLGGAVGIVANQPMQQAGSLDIDAAQKAARFVQWCDCFNIPVITFVDTSGYLPGRTSNGEDHSPRGSCCTRMPRPRAAHRRRHAQGVGGVHRDGHGLGVDYCVAWPTAEIAVMGAPPAVQILHRRRLQAIEDPERRVVEEQELVLEYEERFLNPYIAAERGYVDDVIAASDTRRVLANALDRLHTKREVSSRRRHSNTPL